MFDSKAKAFMLEMFVQMASSFHERSVQKPVGNPVQLCRVTAPKDGCGAKQHDSTDAETVLLLGLSAFSVPQHHETL